MEKFSLPKIKRENVGIYTDRHKPTHGIIKAIFDEVDVGSTLSFTISSLLVAGIGCILCFSLFFLGPHS